MFTRSQVWRAWQLQGCVCKLCGRAIPFDLMHGDHIVPWSLGGPTTIANLQALCGSCNLRKGSQPQEVAMLSSMSSALLRAGRAAAVAGRGDADRPWRYRARTSIGRGLPRRRKTQIRLGGRVPARCRRPISRVLVVVPTLAIADEWQRAASVATPVAPTLPLRSQRDWRAVDPIGDEWLGAIITYQSLFASTEMFLAHADLTPANAHL